MHPAQVRVRALQLVGDGLNDCEVARRLGVPRTTVRDWRRPVRRSVRPREICPRCWRPGRRIRLDAGDYAELLGLYLGDGCISRVGRVHSLRISLDPSYPQILADAHDLLTRAFPENRVSATRADGGATIVLCVYSSHLPCLFPQHGPGKKHDRRIVLEQWQTDSVAAEPWRFLRGCVRSDGCVFVNRTERYRYLTYDFCNRSGDIRALFVHACERVGVACRHNGERVRVNRRASVALMLTHVGLKA